VVDSSIKCNFIILYFAEQVKRFLKIKFFPGLRFIIFEENTDKIKKEILYTISLKKYGCVSFTKGFTNHI
jgi:hypothetical protein